ncbi:MAG TPA: hypothetical protein VFT74_12225 [Isosphaeraceae bacterium]|nr:hypothetical protein [Isosphaeraceae bacterium]
MPTDNPSPSRRPRSHKYPGAPLSEALEFVRLIESRGLDGLPAESLALGLGHRNIRTQSFSAPLSSARQFGLLELTDSGYALTPLARTLLHPPDPSAIPSLRRQALLSSPLYAELAARFSGRKVPEPEILANLLYHNHGLTASAKTAAAEAFLESARFAGVLDPSGTFLPDSPAAPAPKTASPPETNSAPPRKASSSRKSSPVRLDLALWDSDEGKMLRLRAPESISKASFERFLQAFRLHVRIRDE